MQYLNRTEFIEKQGSPGCWKKTVVIINFFPLDDSTMSNQEQTSSILHKINLVSRVKRSCGGEHGSFLGPPGLKVNERWVKREVKFGD